MDQSLAGAGLASPREQDLFDLYTAYDRRFHAAQLVQPVLRPWQAEERSAIVDRVRRILAIEDRYQPNIRARAVGVVNRPGYQVELIQGESWPGVCCSAHFYQPQHLSGRLPFILLCCGHGAGGIRNEGYQAMAARLVRQGARVLVIDNIGQGEREPMGHAHAVIPFACGLTIQGLIVMEAMAWLTWALADDRVDRSRVAAIGNSGGGTLTLFLAALCPELTVLSSSGYPSSFAFIARKEKKHCHCNILPGIVGQLEMWQILGAFAPKPMFLFQGANDHLFAEDLFYRVVRQVGQTYAQTGHEAALHWASVPGPHPWFAEKRLRLSRFLADTLGLAAADDQLDDTVGLLEATDRCYPVWPQDALTLDALAIQLSGIRPDPDIRLWDVYRPVLLPVPADAVGLRGEVRQVFAQFEAFLNDQG
jgi:pimeloyl-ACP methyl ester carboxylesterase